MAGWRVDDGGRVPGRMGVAVVNREQLIEKAARAIHASEVQAGLAADTWEENDKNWYLSNALAAVDALLPKVTTVEELEALPWNAVLATSDGHTYRAESPLIPNALQRGPLTVVWQP